MRIYSFRTYIADYWKHILAYSVLAIIVVGLLFWRLPTLVTGYSAIEAASQHSSQKNLPVLLDNPLNAPFYLLAKAFSFISNELLATRLAAASIGLSTIILFVLLLKRWYGTPTALLGGLLFCTSAWFLHVARLGSPEILLFGVFGIAVAGSWLKRRQSRLSLVVCFALCSTLLYVPGMIWLLVAGIIWQWKTIDLIFKKHLLTLTLSGLALLGVLTPLVLGFIKHPDLLRTYAAIPDQIPNIIEIAKNIARVPYDVLVRFNGEPVQWLGAAPIMDLFTLLVFLIGIYTYIRRYKLGRTPLIVSITLLSTILIGLGSSITLSVIIPFIYLVAAGGVRQLLMHWFRVFPRNPIARSLGWLSIIVLVSSACAYQLTHYFVGWPDAKATQQAFPLKNPKDPAHHLIQ